MSDIKKTYKFAEVNKLKKEVTDLKKTIEDLNKELSQKKG